MAISVPTRSQFAALCDGDDKLLRWFEDLAGTSSETTPTDTDLTAGSALALAREAFSYAEAIDERALSNEVLLWLSKE